jgi:metal-sulfur cluster biosynthetic enzyme
MSLTRTCTREQVVQALGTVFDPELGLSIVDLGLVYDVAIEEGRVRIVMTLTAPGCPIHDAMSEWVQRAVQAVPGVEAVDVSITFDPPWTPDRITASPPR